MEFTPINTQEEFDARVTELYGDVSALQQQVNTLTGERDAHAATITELQSKVKGYETSALKARIAREKGLPAEMADRLSGETEKDIKADADAMAGILMSFHGTDPLAQTEPKLPDEGSVNMINTLRELRGE